jgi:uncharacterized membrane protein YkvA (DUF1232 family)
MSLINKLREAAARLKNDAITVYFVAREPNTPLPVRLLALAVAAYAFSPIDLIPDFIPVLGLLDDLLLVPLGVWLIIKLAPASILETSRTRARDVAAHPTSNTAAVVIVFVWIVCAAIFGHWFLGVLGIYKSDVIEGGLQQVPSLYQVAVLHGFN